MSRHCVAYHAHECLSIRETFGEHLSALSMPHDYYAKEFPNLCIENNLSNITHLCDGKDTVIETVRKDDSLKRRIRLSKTNDSSCRCINFSNPIYLSFEHTRTVGSRASEQILVEWWR